MDSGFPFGGMFGDSEDLQRNLQFFFLCVSRQINNFHAITHWWRYIVDQICGSNKNHSAEIKGNAQIIVAES